MVMLIPTMPYFRALIKRHLQYQVRHSEGADSRVIAGQEFYAAFVG